MGQKWVGTNTLTATRWLSEGLPNTRTEIFSNASHFFLMEQPDKFIQLLTQWLEANKPA